MTAPKDEEIRKQDIREHAERLAKKISERYEVLSSPGRASLQYEIAILAENCYHAGWSMRREIAERDEKGLVDALEYYEKFTATFTIEGVASPKTPFSSYTKTVGDWDIAQRARDAIAEYRAARSGT